MPKRLFSLYIRPLLDPSTLLIALGFAGFFQYYGGRFLIFIAAGLALVGLWAVMQHRWETAIPIQTFFLGTWAYNLFSDPTDGLVGIMLSFLFLLTYAFWKMFGQPRLRDLTALHSIYLTLAILIVWELAVFIQLFWPVEPWSRTFLVIAALIFLQIAASLRLSGETQIRPLLAPLSVILVIVVAIIISTPIPQI